MGLMPEHTRVTEGSSVAMPRGAEFASSCRSFLALWPRGTFLKPPCPSWMEAEIGQDSVLSWENMSRRLWFQQLCHSQARKNILFLGLCTQLCWRTAWPYLETAHGLVGFWWVFLGHRTYSLVSPVQSSTDRKKCPKHCEGYKNLTFLFIHPSICPSIHWSVHSSINMTWIPTLSRT